jgi:hypothetical protein
MKKIVFLLSLFFFWACNENHNQGSFFTLNVNAGLEIEAKLSSIAAQVEKIEPETGDSSLLGTINRISFADSFIFIMDYSPKILQFDRKGKFIRQIGARGKGPGEYSSLSGIAANVKSQRLFVLTHSKLICYDFKGALISETKIVFGEYVETYQGNVCVFSTNFGRQGPNGRYLNVSRLYKIGENGQMLDSILIKSVPTKNLVGAVNGYAQYLSPTVKGLFLYYPVLTSEPLMRDTLYQLKGHSLVPMFRFKFSNVSVNQDGIQQMKITNIYRTSRFIFSDFQTSEGQYNTVCYDEKMDKTILLNDSIYDDMQHSGNVRLFPVDMNKNLFCFYKLNEEPVKLKNGEESEPNPTIYLVSLKD